MLFECFYSIFYSIVSLFRIWCIRVELVWNFGENMSGEGRRVRTRMRVKSSSVGLCIRSCVHLLVILRGAFGCCDRVLQYLHFLVVVEALGFCMDFGAMG